MNSEDIFFLKKDAQINNEDIYILSKIQHICAYLKKLLFFFYTGTTIATCVFLFLFADACDLALLTTYSSRSTTTFKIHCRDYNTYPCVTNHPHYNCYI